MKGNSLAQGLEQRTNAHVAANSPHLARAGDRTFSKRVSAEGKKLSSLGPVTDGDHPRTAGSVSGTGMQGVFGARRRELLPYLLEGQGSHAI